MDNRTFYYARVSSSSQSLRRQIVAFKELGADDRSIITDKVSGKNLDRSGYNALKTTLLRSGDTLVIKSLDRLSRRKEDIKNELQFFKDNNIKLKVLDLPTTMTDFPEEQKWIGDMINNILIEVLGSIAEQERITIHQRQKEGIAAAKSNGTKFGRPRVNKPSNWNDVINSWKSGSITARKAMELTGIKPTTFYSLVKNDA